MAADIGLAEGGTGPAEEGTVPVAGKIPVVGIVPADNPDLEEGKTVRLEVGMAVRHTVTGHLDL